MGIQKFIKETVDAILDLKLFQEEDHFTARIANGGNGLGSISYNLTVWNLTTSGCRVLVSNMTGGGIDNNFDISVSRQAADYKPAITMRTILGL